MTIDERISHQLKQHLPDIDESGVWEHIQTASNAARRRRSAFMTVASLAAAGALVVGWIGLRSLERSLVPVTSYPSQSDVPSEQMAIIHQVVDAVNGREANDFIDAFSPEAHFDPRGNLNATLFSHSQPVHRREQLIGLWMTVLDAWGLKADLHRCHVQDGRGRFAGGQIIGCEVATRWHTLSMEITEEWTYEFNGHELLFWDYRLVDLDPPERALPYGYDLIEEWEAWLQSTDPVAASRYLNPREYETHNCSGCKQWQNSLAPGDPELAARLARLMSSAEKDWTFNGQWWSPDGLIPYDPALADEIEASIQEYLETK